MREKRTTTESQEGITDDSSRAHQPRTDARGYPRICSALSLPMVREARMPIPDPVKRTTHARFVGIGITRPEYVDMPPHHGGIIHNQRVIDAQLAGSPMRVGEGHSGPSIIIRHPDMKEESTMTDNLNPVHFYQTADGGHFSASLTTPHTRKDGKAPKTEPRPIKWLPLAENGEDAVTYTRRTIPAATFAAYMIETDSAKRDAILATCPVTANEDGTPRAFESPIGLTIPQAKIARALVSREQLEAMNAAGIFARPTDRAERAAGTVGAKRTLTEAERNAAALDALFALADEETAPEDSTDDGTDDADDESTDESDEKDAD